VALLSALLGLRPDVPAGTLAVEPLRPSPVGELRVRGLRVAGGELAVALDHDGRLTEVEAPAGLDVRTA
jgi:hypothetical protein